MNANEHRTVGGISDYFIGLGRHVAIQILWGGFVLVFGEEYRSAAISRQAARTPPHFPKAFSLWGMKRLE